MIKITEAIALDFPNDHNINVMVLDLVKGSDKDGKVPEYRWRVYGHYGRSLVAAVRGLLDAGATNHECQDVLELANHIEDIIKSLSLSKVVKYMQDARAQRLETRISNLEEQNTKLREELKNLKKESEDSNE